MAFSDRIDDYTTGVTGTITANGESVGYTITSGVATVSPPNTDQGAEIEEDGTPKLVIDFDIPVTGLSLTFDRSNPGEEYFVEINGTQVDINTLLNAVPPQATFTSSIVGGGTGTHFVTSSGGISSSGTFSNDSLGFLTILTPVDTIGVVGDGSGGGFDVVEVGIDDGLFDVLCFAAGTAIATADGEVAVETLVAGDTVLGTDGQSHTIRAVQVQHMREIHLLRDTRRRPVRIAAGAFGGGLPVRDLLVSRQHRVLVASRIARRLFGQDEVLVPAICLAGLPGIDVDREIDGVSYHHLILDTHQVVLANGAPAETLYTGPMACAVLDGQDDGMTGDAEDMAVPLHSAPARLLADNKTAKKLAAAHARHGRALLETWELARV